MIPPIPDSNNDSIPRIRSFTTVASKSVLASHRTPSINPKKNVAKYRKFSPIILMYADLPQCRIGDYRLGLLQADLLCMMHFQNAVISVKCTQNA